MKKLILSAIAATLAVGPLVGAADAQRRETTVVRERPNGRTVVTQRTVTRPGYRAWRVGDRFDRRYAQSYRRLDNYRSYRLAVPQRGYYWARSGRDAVLLRPNGTVVSVRTRIF